MPRVYLNLAALLLVVSGPAQPQATQTSTTEAKDVASAANAQASVPKSDYRSPFAGYRSDTTEAPRPWREVNDKVEAIGGWRAYAREAASPSPPPASDRPAPTVPGN